MRVQEIEMTPEKAKAMKGRDRNKPCYGMRAITFSKKTKLKT